MAHYTHCQPLASHSVLRDFLSLVKLLSDQRKFLMAMDHAPNKFGLHSQSVQFHRKPTEWKLKITSPLDNRFRIKYTTIRSIDTCIHTTMGIRKYAIG